MPTRLTMSSGRHHHDSGEVQDKPLDPTDPAGEAAHGEGSEEEHANKTGGYADGDFIALPVSSRLLFAMIRKGVMNPREADVP